MRIGLLGFKYENENLGCVALTYSAIAVLNELFPEGLTIVNITDCHENMDFARSFFENVHLVEQVYYLRTRFMLMDRETISAVRKCDAVLDITFGDNFSDIYLPHFVRKTTHLKLIIEALGVPLILMPQTIGPFEDTKLLKQALRAIKKSKRVYSRDILSKDFVKKYLPKQDVFVATDLALVLPYEKVTYISSKIKIGVNVSGLLWNGGFINSNQFGLTVDYQQYITSLLSQICNDRCYEVHLIPHVVDVSAKAQDGDLAVAHEMLEKYPSIALAPSFATPIDAKNYIAQMDIFIGARMHSTIAAFSSHVATIPFAYSRKFEGMYDGIGYPYVVDGRKLTTEQALTKTMEFITKADELKRSGDAAMQIVQQLLSDFKSDLKRNLLDKQ